MSHALDQFLQSVQGKAYAQAVHAVGNREDALDVVQDSMLKLAKSYGQRERDEWPMLFQRILQNQIRDWYRRQKVRSILFWWEQYPSEAGVGPEQAPSDIDSPEEQLSSAESLGDIGSAVRGLPQRQQQVFLLRAFWGHNIEETAEILGCGVATVKTHYARALKVLRQQIEVGA